MTTPAGGASTLKVSRPRAEVPPGHSEKPIDKDSSCKGPIVSVAIRTLPDAGMVAVSVATVCGAFGSVVTSNAAVDCPGPITTVGGTSTLAALLDSATSTPVAAAGAARERVPVTDRPVATDVADSDSP